MITDTTTLDAAKARTDAILQASPKVQAHQVPQLLESQAIAISKLNRIVDDFCGDELMQFGFGDLEKDGTIYPNDERIDFALQTAVVKGLVMKGDDTDAIFAYAVGRLHFERYVEADMKQIWEGN